MTGSALSARNVAFVVFGAAQAPPEGELEGEGSTFLVNGKKAERAISGLSRAWFNKEFPCSVYTALTRA